VDSLLNQHWERGLSPFDGDCLVFDDVLSVEDLRSVLSVIIPTLEGQYAAQALYTFDDWHQHDGYVTERSLSNWGTLAAVARNTDALIESRQGDTYVHRSFYPEDFSFLLRYDIDEDSGDGASLTGTFDLSASSTVVSKLTELLPPELRSRVRVEASKGYFDRMYAG
jgi:hypothetical protein